MNMKSGKNVCFHSKNNIHYFIFFRKEGLKML